MDPPSSNGIISSELNIHIQPDQSANYNITYMDVALYKAAARGEIEVFNNHQGIELGSLRTPNHNTVLHVYLASHEHFGVLRLDVFRSWLRFIFAYVGFTSRMLHPIPSVLKQVQNENPGLKIGSNFAEKILDKCPSLLLQANAEGKTPLHIAAMYGHSAIVKVLIKYHAAKGPDGDLHSLLMDQLGAVREMLRMTDLESNTALHVAAQNGHRLVVQELLEFEDPDFPYSVNSNQETPLYIAARRGDGPLLSIILDKLKSAAHGGPHGRTALHAAAMAGDAEATRTILEKKGNLVETDENGQTPLHYAAHLGHYLVVKELLKWDKGAAYIADKNSEMTPLLMAARQGHGRIVKEIISNCPDCCEKLDKRGWNLFHFLAVRSSPHLSDICFLQDDSRILYGSVRSLIYAKDARGLTPQQVHDAFVLFPRSPFSKKIQEKKEQIVKLLDDITNEEVAESGVRPLLIKSSTPASIEKARDAHLLVAALIATIAFTAAATVPGGYKTEQGPDQGTSVLILDSSFHAFIFADVLAFFSSMAAINIYMHMTPPYITIPLDIRSFEMATRYIHLAVASIMWAFSFGAYAVLKPSPELAAIPLWIGFVIVCFALLESIVLYLKTLFLNHFKKLVVEPLEKKML